ncbi:CDC16 protein [Coemansia sp. Benny D115]|nr:CDC16 protein [Coemansia sp. Benny D115]
MGAGAADGSSPRQNRALTPRMLELSRRLGDIEVRESLGPRGAAVRSPGGMRRSPAILEEEPEETLQGATVVPGAQRLRDRMRIPQSEPSRLGGLDLVEPAKVDKMYAEDVETWEYRERRATRGSIGSSDGFSADISLQQLQQQQYATGTAPRRSFSGGSQGSSPTRGLFAEWDPHHAGNSGGGGVGGVGGSGGCVPLFAGQSPPLRASALAALAGERHKLAALTRRIHEDWVEVSTSMRELRVLIAGNGGLPVGPGTQRVRGMLWLAMLEVRDIALGGYSRALQLCPSMSADKINNDAFRTLRGDMEFRARVPTDAIVRVLNAVLSAPDRSAADPPRYVQGMNTLLAPFLYVMGEGAGFYAFRQFLRKECPLYARPSLPGVHACVHLVDECLAHVDPLLFSHLRRHGAVAKIYAFPAAMTLSASVGPLRQVVRLWDFLLAFGVHLNVVCIVAQLLSMRELLVTTTTPMAFLRSWPPLRAESVIRRTREIYDLLPEPLRRRIKQHAHDPQLAEALASAPPVPDRLAPPLKRDLPVSPAPPVVVAMPSAENGQPLRPPAPADTPVLVPGPGSAAPGEQADSGRPRARTFSGMVKRLRTAPRAGEFMPAIRRVRAAPGAQLSNGRPSYGGRQGLGISGSAAAAPEDAGAALPSAFCLRATSGGNGAAVRVRGAARRVAAEALWRMETRKLSAEHSSGEQSTNTVYGDSLRSSSVSTINSAYHTDGDATSSLGPETSPHPKEQQDEEREVFFGPLSTVELRQMHQHRDIHRRSTQPLGIDTQSLLRIQALCRGYLCRKQFSRPLADLRMLAMNGSASVQRRRTIRGTTRPTATATATGAPAAAGATSMTHNQQTPDTGRVMGHPRDTAPSTSSLNGINVASIVHTNSSPVGHPAPTNAFTTSSASVSTACSAAATPAAHAPKRGFIRNWFHKPRSNPSPVASTPPPHLQMEVSPRAAAGPLIQPAYDSSARKAPLFFSGGAPRTTAANGPVDQQLLATPVSMASVAAAGDAMMSQPITPAHQPVTHKFSSIFKASIGSLLSSKSSSTQMRSAQTPNPSGSFQSSVSTSSLLPVPHTAVGYHHPTQQIDFMARQRHQPSFHNNHEDEKVSNGLASNATTADVSARGAAAVVSRSGSIRSAIGMNKSPPLNRMARADSIRSMSPRALPGYVPAMARQASAPTMNQAFLAQQQQPQAQQSPESPVLQPQIQQLSEQQRVVQVSVQPSHGQLSKQSEYEEPTVLDEQDDTDEDMGIAATVTRMAAPVTTETTDRVSVDEEDVSMVDCSTEVHTENTQEDSSQTTIIPRSSAEDDGGSMMSCSETYASSAYDTTTESHQPSINEQIAHSSAIDAAALRLSLRLSADASSFGSFGLAAFASASAMINGQHGQPAAIAEEPEDTNNGEEPKEDQESQSKPQNEDNIGNDNDNDNENNDDGKETQDTNKDNKAANSEDDAATKKQEQEDRISARLRSLRSRRLANNNNNNSGDKLSETKSQSDPPALNTRRFRATQTVAGRSDGPSTTSTAAQQKQKKPMTKMSSLQLDRMTKLNTRRNSTYMTCRIERYNVQREGSRPPSPSLIMQLKAQEKRDRLADAGKPHHSIYSSSSSSSSSSSLIASEDEEEEHNGHESDDIEEMGLIDDTRPLTPLLLSSEDEFEPAETDLDDSAETETATVSLNPSASISSDIKRKSVELAEPLHSQSNLSLSATTTAVQSSSRSGMIITSARYLLNEDNTIVGDTDVTVGFGSSIRAEQKTTKSVKLMQLK